MTNRQLRDLAYRLVQAYTKLIATPEAGTAKQLSLLSKDDFAKLWKASGSEKE